MRYNRLIKKKLPNYYLIECTIHKAKKVNTAMIFAIEKRMNREYLLFYDIGMSLIITVHHTQHNLKKFII